MVMGIVGTGLACRIELTGLLHPIDSPPPGFKVSSSLSTGVGRMAASILSLHLLPISSSSFSSISYPTEPIPQGWHGRQRAGRKPVRPAPVHRVAALSSAILEPLHQDFLYVLADAGAGYSLASYYTSLGLFVISVPGLWSLIKRSVKSKVVQKTFITEGKGQIPNQVAGEILSFFTRNNFVVVDRGEAITFEGMMIPSRGQAALLTFCTCISLASVALVLTITVPDLGNNWFWLTSLSPLAGLYYWKKASRKEQIKVKMTVEEEGRVSEITVRGDDQQVEQVRKELGLSEKGMVYVKGLFERD